MNDIVLVPHTTLSPSHPSMPGSHSPAVPQTTLSPSPSSPVPQTTLSPSLDVPQTTLLPSPSCEAPHTTAVDQALPIGSIEPPVTRELPQLNPRLQFAFV